MHIQPIVPPMISGAIGLLSSGSKYVGFIMNSTAVMPIGNAASTQPDLILPLLGGKFAGALLGLVIAMRMTRADSKQPSKM